MPGHGPGASQHPGEATGGKSRGAGARGTANSETGERDGGEKYNGNNQDDSLTPAFFLSALSCTPETELEDSSTKFAFWIGWKIILRKTLM